MVNDTKECLLTSCCLCVHAVILANDSGSSDPGHTDTSKLLAKGHSDATQLHVRIIAAHLLAF